MGVAGAGKTTVGRLLAGELGWPYFEADDFHSPANKEKMARGVPLNDQDRAPWLAAIRERMEECVADGRSAVFTCSALKESYRQVLAAGLPAVTLVYLSADPATIEARVRQRENHYLKANLVRSQFDVLEAPANAFTVDARESPAALVAKIRAFLG